MNITEYKFSDYDIVKVVESSSSTGNSDILLYINEDVEFVELTKDDVSALAEHYGILKRECNADTTCCNADNGTNQT